MNSNYSPLHGGMSHWQDNEEHVRQTTEGECQPLSSQLHSLVYGQGCEAFRARTAAAAAKSLQLCPTLCDSIDGSPPGSPVPGILQARTLEWVAISFSNAWKWKVKAKSLSRVQLQRPRGLQPTRLLHPWDFPGKSTGVGCHCPLHIHTTIYKIDN